jgi:hypothetical protein
MSDAKPRTVKITRAQALAAQLIEKLDRRSGAVTNPNVQRVAAAGRNAGVNLPGGSTRKVKTPAKAVTKAH